MKIKDLTTVCLFDVVEDMSKVWRRRWQLQSIEWILFISLWWALRYWWGPISFIHSSRDCTRLPHSCKTQQRNISAYIRFPTVTSRQCNPPLPPIMFLPEVNSSFSSHSHDLLFSWWVRLRKCRYQLRRVDLWACRLTVCLIVQTWCSKTSSN